MSGEENQTGITGLLQMPIEDRRAREDNEARRDQERKEEAEKREKERKEDQERRDREHEERVRAMQAQIDMMQTWMDQSREREEQRIKRTEELRQLTLTKLTLSEDIEAYLSTFERMMEAFKVGRELWAFKLAPQLSGKAQQAFAAMDRTKTSDYDEVKAAILRRYDVSEETYRQRFRTAKRTSGEGYLELATRLRDLVEKWLTGCTTVEAVMEKIVVEQLIETMPRDLKVWIRDRKPASGADAGKLADDYSRARQQELQVSPRVLDHNEVKRCHTCRKTGHLMRDCPQRAESAEKPDTAKLEPKGETPSKDKTNRKPVVCYNCGQLGHIAVRCPNNSNLFCSAVGTRLSVRRPGIVEGTMVQDIILDTGCSQTMVREDLAKTSKLLEGEAVTVRCAHGDTVLYPLSEVELELAGKKMMVRAAISENLPASVLLGTDVPELGSLLSVENLKIGRGGDSYAVTRAQARKDAEEEKARLFTEAISGVRPTPLLSEIPEGQDSEESDHEISDSEVDDSGTNMEADEREECRPQNSSDDWLGTFDDDLFEPGKAKKPLSRKEKRKDRHEAGLVRAKDKPRKKTDKIKINPPVTKSELVRLQETDGTLAVIRKKAVDVPSSEFFWRDGVLYKHWRPDAHTEVEQIVLPKQCRRTVLELAHSIPMGGHLGKKKTTSRIQQRFYWPTIHRDVADFCRSCEVCQKFRRQQKTKAPMMPLPVIAEPFQRIAMDIVGPLPPKSIR